MPLTEASEKSRRTISMSADSAHSPPVSYLRIVVLVLLAADATLVGSVISPALFTIVTAIIIGREITISALREWMAELGRRGVVRVGWIGKVKTTIQFIAIN